MKNTLIFLSLIFILSSCFYNKPEKSEKQEKVENVLKSDIWADDLEEIINKQIVEEETKTENEDITTEDSLLTLDSEDKTQTWDLQVAASEIKANLWDFINYEKFLLWDSYLSFPKSIDFWQVEKVWEDIIYPKFQKLSIKKQDILKDIFNCSNLTEALKSNSLQNFYWNSCHDIVKNESISFYITRIKQKELFYEKHFVDYKHWLYIVYELEKTSYNKDSWVTLEEKNKNFFRSNWTFENEIIIDTLVKEIVR